MTAEPPPSELSRVRRNPSRAAYDIESVNAVLDAGALGHVGIVADGRPVVIPMLYGRDGDALYLHGSVASRLLRHLGGGAPVCVEVTHVDALVLARSAFHHSMNYRSAVVFGTSVKVDGDEAEHGLRVITEHLVPGRWDEVRPPNEVEMRQTAVLRLDIAEASAKARTHGVVDDDEDLELPVWAGLVPVLAGFGAPVPDPDLAPDVGVPASVSALIGG
ncbi:MAG: pyridoxamine 5'-phosphate oxidase family protein [Acidimicrobiales bacterium]